MQLTTDQNGLRAHRMNFRVRYSEIDQLGTFYNSRALEWFECGRVEYLRAMEMPYDQMEARGCCLPLIQAHLDFQGRAGFDDLLTMVTSAEMVGRARVRFNMHISHADGQQERPRRVVSGYTVHAVTDSNGRPVRCPDWLVEKLASDAPAGAENVVEE